MIKRIAPDQAKPLIEQGRVILVDIRDKASYQASHIQNSTHLDSHSLQDFLTEADPDKPLLVYCYHGHSSLSAAQFLLDKGFEDVASLDGGFELWRGLFPDTCT